MEPKRRPKVPGDPRPFEAELAGEPLGPLADAEVEVGVSGLSLAEQVALVPTEPGCYLWKGERGKVLYVGKAKNLRARMKQYVLGQDEREKIPLLMSQVRSFEYIVVSSEHEALVLEMNLINQYDPPFNVDFRDDKSYPYIAVTEGDVYPAIKFTRERHKPKTRYFGPYTNARAARETIDLCRKVVPVCTGTCPEWRKAQRLLAAHPEQAAAAPNSCWRTGEGLASTRAWGWARGSARVPSRPRPTARTSGRWRSSCRGTAASSSST